MADETNCSGPTNDRLPPGIKLPDPAVQPKAGNYRIVYPIVTTTELPQALPSFSKVILKNALASLGALGFSVAIAKIEFDPEFLRRASCKPSRRTRATTQDPAGMTRRRHPRSEPPAAPAI
ncbi:DUF6119 family protein [Paraburkholderia caledonica]|uniref:Uncharacterized protein n=1 Tax=Paraburkholderia caledonica TaxID=134536 RepID=A0AB73IPC7_9BURK|nr:hypothetical protein [Paraburkholderia caledonica]